MTSYSSIAVGTDGTDTAEVAVRRAAGIARDAGAKLTIISAWHGQNRALLDPPTADTSVPVMGQRNAEEYAEAARAIAEEEGATDVETYTVRNPAANALIDAVDEKNIELIVIGSQGVHSLAGRLFGSVAMEVLRHSPVDVMVVNTDAVK
ncbi:MULTISPECIES: universal stress protein [Corynebacterium]|uniref:universal stress protein n=1 Tax=Corynebacterium TaxID=1716 RepID=UPI00254DE502|nr:MULTISPECIES: universal stress protein [Corynebacterium]MDK6260397.1 universal stress protein [Corynebacterium frankenforstense]MDK8894342.1 universal stress protein [Corynebacterium sp. MSK006]